MTRGSRSINIAILAIGGQGGGVMAQWLVEVAERTGYRAQYTSVPGVAQRTGATIYYLELFPENEIGDREPVLALMPMPGDVDIVLASELMEAGRALVRGLVTPERTTLIASTHRVYAIDEKSARGDGRRDAGRVLEIAEKRARKFVRFDMQDAARRGGSVISAAMLGALAGSGALPIDRTQFEDVIRAGGQMVEPNLRSFAIAYEKARSGAEEKIADSDAKTHGDDIAVSKTVQPLVARLKAELPEAVHALAREGLRRVVDYQDPDYGTLYLDRLLRVAGADRAAGGPRQGHTLTLEAARHLALWMSFEDTFRVADLKTRGSRFRRVRRELGVGDDQVVDITEFMHPRLDEFCDSLPSPIARLIFAWPTMKALLRRAFRQGRQVRTSRLGGFLLLYLLGKGRGIRRRTPRFRRENEAIEAWLDRIVEACSIDYALALELVLCQRLVKGYGETREQAGRDFDALTQHYEAGKGRAGLVAELRRLRDAALAGDGAANPAQGRAASG